MIKNAQWIREMATLMIDPFIENQVRVLEIKKPYMEDHYPERKISFGEMNTGLTHKVISYGTGSYGYDLRLSPKDFRVFRHIPGQVLNPKAFNPNFLYQAELLSCEYGDYFILPHHTYALGVSLERLDIPENIEVIFIGKSTYARAGIIVNMTPGEAGWKGHLTIEISNSSDADAMIFANEGICQALFFEGEPTDIVYNNLRKYQNQSEEVTLARV